MMAKVAWALFITVAAAVMLTGAVWVAAAVTAPPGP
jgi:hypothetical protein